MAVHIFVRGGGGNFDVLECMHERGVYMGGNFCDVRGDMLLHVTVTLHLAEGGNFEFWNVSMNGLSRRGGNLTVPVFARRVWQVYSVFN